MLVALKSWWKARGRVRGSRVRRFRSLRLEYLEARLAPAHDTLASAIPLSFLGHTVQMGTLAQNQTDLYVVTLHAGDEIAADAAAPAPSSLASSLRVFDSKGQQLAIQQNTGGDTTLTFDAPTAGVYYVGISANGNFGYDTHTTNSGHGATSAGDYGLTLNLGSALVPQSGSNFSSATAQAVTGNTILQGTYAGGATAYYAFTATDTGRLTATVTPDALTVAAPRLTLYDSLGQLLIQSDAANGGSAQLVQHLRPGTYFLGVTPVHANSNADQTYVLDTTFAEAVRPFQGLPVGKGSFSEATGDFNHDGNLDIVTANDFGFSVSVALGRGDGSFQTPVAYTVPDLRGRGSYPAGIAVGDVNNDGNLDIVTANSGDDSVTVLLGNGDGTFGNARTFAVPNGVNAVALGDFRHDGKLDIVTSNPGFGTVSVLLGNGDGTFQPAVSYYGHSSGSVAVGDFNRDGMLDIVTTDSSTGAGATILLGNGDGTFQPAVSYGTGPHPADVVVVDVNHDGNLDLIIADGGSGVNTVSVLLGNGDGTFQPSVDYASGNGTLSVARADFNHDGNLDIVATDSSDTTVSVLLGRRDGTFSSASTYALGNGQNTNPEAVVTGDFNNDGNPDIATVNQDSTVTLLLGKGDGTFVSPTSYGVGHGPSSVAVGVFNRDGNADAVVANYADGSITVLLGNGNGTFLPGVTYDVGYRPDFVAVGDFNHDGNPDIVVANSGDNTLSILLGRGDGTFLPPVSYAVGDVPFSVSVGDFNNDGFLDLVSANHGDGTLSVLLGRGDGTFRPAVSFQVGNTPLYLTVVEVADFNKDGKLDLVVGNEQFANRQIAVLLGNGDGTFKAPVFYSGGGVNYTSDIAVGDFNHDGKLDIVDISGSTILLGNGDGTFQPYKDFYPGYSIGSVAVADFNKDGNLDIAASSYGPVTVSLGQANGPLGIDDPKISASVSYAVGNYPNAVAVGDFNNDGNLDIVNTNYTDRTVSVLLGQGDGTFRTAASANASLDLPLFQDLNGDGIADTVILNSAGDILFRRGLPGGTNQFAPPVVLNAGHPSRDITVYRTENGWAVAAVDQVGNTVSRYTYDPAMRLFTRSTAFTTGSLPVRIAATDLTGDGLGDLVVANDFDNSVTIALQTPSGQFATPLTLPVGVLPSDITFADLGGSYGPDIVISDQVSGDFTVLRNDAAHTFAHEDRYRAGTGLFGIDDSTGVQSVSSQLQTVGLVAGHFTSPSHDDLVTLNRGADSFTLLPTQAGGTFADPSPGSTYFTSQQPSQVVALTLPGGPLASVAVLMQDLGQIWIYRDTGNGPLSAPLKIDAGNAPTSFSVATVKGKLALLIGNKYGDILTVLYDGRTFAPDRADLNNLPLAVGTLAASGRQYAVVADQQHDKVSLYYRIPGQNTFDTGIPITGNVPLLAPGAVQVFEVTGDANPYLVVANSLSNDVLVYHYDPLANQFVYLTSAAVGFNPVSVTVADINGDNVPDLLVANQGSNDVSILVGNTTGGTWAATPYQRLASGGSGPVGVTVGDFTGRGLPDVRVTNGDGSVATLPGIGSGGKGSAFFQPPGTVPALGGTIADEVFDPTTGREFVVSGGQLSVFDGTTFTALPTPGFVTTLGVADGLLVAGFADHTVGVLTEEGTLLERTAAFADQPSALQALQDGDHIDVYLTVDGSQVPVFISLLIPVLTELPDSAAVAQATGIAGGELVLVATLLSGGLEEGTAQDVPVATGEPSFVLFLPAVKVSVPVGGGQAVEEEVPVALVVRTPDGLPPTEEFKARVKDALTERLATQQLFDSVEDLIDAIRQALDQFRGDSKQDDDFPSAFRGDLEFVALDRVAGAVVDARE